MLVLIVGITQAEIEDLALVAHLVTHPYQFLPYLVAFAHTDHHVADQRTVQTM